MTVSAIDDTKPTHLSPQTADVRLQFTRAKGEIEDLYIRSPSVIDGRAYGFIENDIGATESDPTRWQRMLTDAPPYARVVLPFGDHLITAGAGGNGIDSLSTILIRKPLLIDLGGSRILWQPTVSNDTLLTVSSVGMPVSDIGITEESTISGFSVINGRVIGNRVNRANAFKFIRVDYLNMDVYVHGVKGFSLNMQRSRESMMVGSFRTRFNAYTDYVNFQNSVPDVLMSSDDSIGDTTNFCNFLDMQLVYPFGRALVIDKTSKMSFTTMVLHGMQLGNAPFDQEGYIIQIFGGSRGFTGGAANNIYAEMHKPITGNETSANNLTWKPAIRKSRLLRISQSSEVNIARLTINGSFPDSCISLDQSSLSLQSAAIGGAESQTTWHTSQTFTADATTNLITMDAATPNLLTGDAVRFTTTTTLPAPLRAYRSSLTLNNTYYMRLTNGPTNTIYSVHANWHDSMFNTSPIDLTTAGTGVHTLLCQHGEVIELNNASTLTCDTATNIDNDRWHVNDDYTSRVIGNYTGGIVQSQSDIARQFGNVVVLSALKGADMTLTTDQQFKNVVGAVLPYYTMLVAVCVSGVATGAVGGIYTAASKGGNPFFGVLPTTSWSTLTSANHTIEWNFANNGVGAGATAVTQGSGSGRSTAVTCNALRGVITTQATSLAAGADASFTVNNTSVAVGDNVSLQLVSGSTANTSDFRVAGIAANSFVVRAHNLSAATADTGAAVLNFHVDKIGPLASSFASLFVPPYLSLTTGSSTPCIVDFYIVGIPVNHS